MLGLMRTSPRERFAVRRDEFSVQLSLSDDPLFWVRLLMPVGQSATLSDFKRSKASDSVMAEALSEALGQAAGRKSIGQLEFLDLAPRGCDRADAEIEAAEIVKAVVIFALSQGLQIANVKISRRGKKFDLLVKLEPNSEKS